jgi:hypothetical protein
MPEGAFRRDVELEGNYSLAPVTQTYTECQRFLPQSADGSLHHF